MIVKVLHLEPTDACNAACPQCAREFDQTFNKNDLHHLSVEQIKNLFTDSQIKQLDKMYMCGDYGDPAAGKHTLDIYRYFRNINPNIILGMHTNGGLRSRIWWNTLGKIINQNKDYVVFSIDGLADTNHIYRVNVDYQKVINNAKAFIAAGGVAHWEMLVFSHNEHQVDQAEHLARNLGFKWFRAKVSRRFNSVPVEFLGPPTSWNDPIVTKGSISCQALTEQSVYVSAKGILYPCCWLGVSDYTLNTFSAVQESWKSNPIQICKDTCTKSDKGTSFTNQWQREVQF
jgi:hypothetical protein